MKRYIVFKRKEWSGLSIDLTEGKNYEILGDDVGILYIVDDNGDNRRLDRWTGEIKESPADKDNRLKFDSECFNTLEATFNQLTVRDHEGVFGTIKSGRLKIVFVMGLVVVTERGKVIGTTNMESISRAVV